MSHRFHVHMTEPRLHRLLCTGSAGTCCCPSHSSCWNRHLTLVSASDHVTWWFLLLFSEPAFDGRFDAKSGDIKLFVDPLTNVHTAYCPQV